MLQSANRLMETERYEQAYPLLKRLADRAAEHGMPIRAANLYLRAARARLEMGSAPDALQLAQRAIALLNQAGRTERLRQLLPVLIDDLEKRGYHEQAVGLRAEMTALTGSRASAKPQTEKGSLPPKCPACNGPVRAGEIDWIDERTAQCPYCGTTMQAQ
jgi:hypothetical protein